MAKVVLLDSGFCREFSTLTWIFSFIIVFFDTYRYLGLQKFPSDDHVLALKARYLEPEEFINTYTKLGFIVGIFQHTHEYNLNVRSLDSPPPPSPNACHPYIHVRKTSTSRRPQPQTSPHPQHRSHKSNAPPRSPPVPDR